MKTDKTRNFTQGPILGPFLSFAIPVLLFCFIGFFNGMEYTRFVMVQGIVGVAQKA